jgi:glycyl-tRNA synthetase beta chain
VADAIEAHYRPRFAGDGFRNIGVLRRRVADKLDALSGPSAPARSRPGTRILRPAPRALGVIRIRRSGARATAARLRARPALRASSTSGAGYFQGAGYSANEVEAAHAAPERLDLRRGSSKRCARSRSPEAESLAAANKRIGTSSAAVREFDMALPCFPRERLCQRLRGCEPVEKAPRPRPRAPQALAALKRRSTRFRQSHGWTRRRVRDNWIGFLGTLHGTMNRIADLSKLAK